MYKQILLASCALFLVTGCGSKKPRTLLATTVPLQAELAFEQEAGDRVFFALNEYTLSDEAKATLDRQILWLKNNPNTTFEIQGHADERGTREYNLALGERRAKAAQAYLVSNGIDIARSTVVSFGKERPAVIGHDESAWSQNRRSVTIIVKR